MRNYDLEIAECKGNPKNLNKIRKHLFIRSLFSNFFYQKNSSEIEYLLSSIYKELGLKNKSLNLLKNLFSTIPHINWQIAICIS